MQQIYKKTPLPKCDFNKVASTFLKNAEAATGGAEAVTRSVL